MAVVRLTQERRTIILNTIAAKFQPQIKAQYRSIQEDLRSELYDALVPPTHQELCSQVEHDMVNWSTCMYLKLHDLEFEFAFPQQVCMPANLESRYRHAQPKPNKFSAEAQAKIKAATDKIKHLNNERVKLQEHITDLFTHVVTLQQLVQVWPSALEYCSPDIITLYNKEKAPPKPRFNPDDHQLSDEAKVLLVKTRVL